MDCSLQGTSVHRILGARILEWVAISSSRGSSWSLDWILVSCSSCSVGGFFTAEPLGKPNWQYIFKFKIYVSLDVTVTLSEIYAVHTLIEECQECIQKLLWKTAYHGRKKTTMTRTTETCFCLLFFFFFLREIYAPASLQLNLTTRDTCRL